MTDRVANPGPFPPSTVRSPYCCAKCGRYGSWRHGVHFDHQMICHFCNEVWEPDAAPTVADNPGVAILADLQQSFESIKDEPIVYGRPVPIANALDVPHQEPRQTKTRLVVRGTPKPITSSDFFAAPAVASSVRIYFAASFHRQGEIRGYRDELLAKLNEPPLHVVDFEARKDTRIIFESCSAWLDEGSQDGTEQHAPAITDPAGPAFHGGVLFKCIEAIKSCDVFIAFTEPAGTKSRGGRHIEMGAALALGKTVIVVGPVESGGYAIPFGDKVPDYVVDRFRVLRDGWDAARVAKWVTLAVTGAERVL